MIENITNKEYTLYMKDANGNIRYRKIYNYGQTIYRESAVVGGQHQTVSDFIPFGLAGRTLQEQIDLKMNSIVNKLIDKGFVHSIYEAELIKPTNSLGLPRPMLAKRIDRVNLSKIDFSNAIIQHKYDGHRCMIAKVNGRIIAYSKNGKELTAIKEIISAAGEILDDGKILDGELYCHGLSLQKISSLAKKRQPETESLSFICYDIVSSESYPLRSIEVEGITYKSSGPYIICAPKLKAKYLSLPSLFELRDESIALGYEGLIVRIDGYGYEDGKRSMQLLKVKKCEDAEFLVKDIIPSKYEWAILVCIAKNGKTFTATSPGTEDEKKECYINKNNFIGRHVTLEYANLTDDGIPFHPVAKCWRETE